MIRYSIYSTIGCFFFAATLHAVELITGDNNAAPNTTFSFPISTFSVSPLGNIYIGAQEAPIDNKNFALSRLPLNTLTFEPIAPELVTLNGKIEQNNPLFGQAISALSVLKPHNSSDIPVVVTATQPTIVYVIEKSFLQQPTIMASSFPLRDSIAEVSEGIVDLTTNILSHVFVAVKPAQGNFGDPNSGIALLVRGFQEQDTVFGQIDAITGRVVTNPRSFPLDKTSPLVNITSSELASMDSHVALHWNDALQRVFIGLQTTSNTGTEDGTRAIVVGKIDTNGGLSLYPIAPTSAFAPGNSTSIVGARNAQEGMQQSVAITALSSMHTSTGLDYLIMSGSINNEEINQQSVSAIPLVSTGDAIGTVASKDAQPFDLFSSGDISKFVARMLEQPATTHEAMPQSIEPATQVGAGVLLAGNITQLVVRNDTVFALVGTDTIAERASGIYSSQALFDAKGKIKGWTAWQRAVGTTVPALYGTLNASLGTFIFVTNDTTAASKTVLETTWSDGNPEGLRPITSLLNSLFNQSNGGIQSLSTFLPTTPGLADISLMVVGGINTLVMIQTGLDNGGIIIPTLGSEYSTESYEKGTISTMPIDKTTIVITGGALSDIGPITASEIASNETNGWLVIGGSNGIAVLMHEDGTGWNTEQNELGNTFDGLTAGMTFKTIGNYTFVKKIISDHDDEHSYLYIVTHDRIDRVDLNTIDFNNFTATTIATKEQFDGVSNNGSLLDAVISQSLALIATTDGLFRNNNTTDIRTIEKNDTAAWVSVPVAETAGASTQLLTTTRTNRSQDITRFDGGHLYVLTSNEGLDQSRVDRFSIRPLSAQQAVQSTTIEPFNDLFVKDIPSFFINFGNFNSIFSTDGALYFASRSQHAAAPPRTVLTPSYLPPQVGVRNVGERSTILNIPYNNGTEINALQQSQASGSWIIAGDFGMQVLE
jgi:hypothetical protein